MTSKNHRIGGVVLLSVAALFCSVGCKSEEGRAAMQIFDEDLQPLFEERCAVCHFVDGEESGGLFIGEDHGPETMVSVPSLQIDMNIVEPGSLEDSYLWHKLKGTHREIGGEGEAMPYAQPMLDDNDMNKVEEYILAL